MNKNNLRLRLLAALVLIPIAIICVFLGGYYFLGLIVLVTVQALREFHYMMLPQGTRIQRKFMTPIAIAIPILVYLNELLILSWVIGLFIIITFVIELFRNRPNPATNIAMSIFALIYPVLFFASLIAIRERYSMDVGAAYIEGGWYLMLVFAGIWMCDSAAYITGSLIGKHKLFPRVSPNKSVEGAVAGLIASIGICAVGSQFTASVSIEFGLLMGLVIGVAAQIGDLIESLIKRDFGVKDAGSLIPGHGGILDRADSVLFTAPIMWLFYQIAKVG